MLSVLLLLGSGMLNAAMLVGSWSALGSTVYGRLVAAKVAPLNQTVLLFLRQHGQLHAHGFIANLDGKKIRHGFAHRGFVAGRAVLRTSGERDGQHDHDYANRGGNESAHTGECYPPT